MWACRWSRWNVPMGLAFEIADLMLLQGWVGAEFHNVHMVVELDHCVEGEEHEEVVAFYAGDSQLRKWILWRGRATSSSRPPIGRSCCRGYGTVADALESLSPARVIESASI